MTIKKKNIKSIQCQFSWTRTSAPVGQQNWVLSYNFHFNIRGKLSIIRKITIILIRKILNMTLNCLHEELITVFTTDKVSSISIHFESRVHIEHVLVCSDIALILNHNVNTTKTCLYLLIFFIYLDHGCYTQGCAKPGFFQKKKTGVVENRGFNRVLGGF